MSLIDKSVDFNSTITGLTNAVYSVVKQIFTNSSLDTVNNFIYFDTDKKNGINFNNESAVDYLRVVYLINNNSYTYNYRTHSGKEAIKQYSKIYYNISAKKDIIAFGLNDGILDFGIGYDEKIGFWEFFIGSALSSNNIDLNATLFLSDYVLKKAMRTYTNSSSYGYNHRWSSSNGNLPLSLIQVPLMITSGNFESLFEVFSCYSSKSFSKAEVIYSNNKYYKLLYPQNEFGANLDKGWSSTVILAMEVADD